MTAIARSSRRHCHAFAWRLQVRPRGRRSDTAVAGRIGRRRRKENGQMVGAEALLVEVLLERSSEIVHCGGRDRMARAFG